ncbi:Mu transposase C-terminal domain-containing protein [Endozoicomonas gorgoniicola]|uniref:Mu transposase C-terminal domain-containing protein n=1 Tax=Endozoicomonas gorgoniicola TaxID=1234144 RepID=A0ABT3N2R8_9GAMM|nr:Mu transposase C-terminal domain-containing protein [Endozoicomonas gorgoniicola]MCW7555916.1 Mu transposase C-terminal domain-containing protein [Endozoicomonas gorgoniicola]
MSRFIEGTKIRLEALDGDKHEYVLAAREGENIRLESLLEEDRSTTLSLSGLQDALKSGRIEFISSSGDEEKKMSEDLMVFTEEERNETLKKYKYLMGLIDRGIQYWSPQYIEDLLPEVAAELGDKKPPSWRTICRWHSNYVKAGYSIRGLYSATFKKGNRKSRLKEEVEKCVKKAVDYYSSEHRPTKKAAYKRLENALEEVNGLRRSKDIKELPVPSYRAFLDRLEKLTPYEKKSARYGKRKAKIEFSPIAEGVKTTRVMERVCVDHTKLDLFVVDSETLMPIGRPWLTLAIDEYSRSIVGFYISFRDPDFIVLIKLIRNIIQQKSSILEQYSFLENEWLCYGVPELFIFDNGKEFWCDDLEVVLAELNIQYAFNPVQHPWFKGKVERKFGTVNTQLLSQMEGKTFSSLAERDDYNPKENAVIRFNTFVEIFYKWVVDEYQIAQTTEGKIIPNLYWKKSVEEFPPKLVEADRLNIVLGRTEESKLRKGGIFYKKIRYDSEQLASYRARAGSVMTSYKVDPDDLSSIYVFNKLDRKYIRVEAIDQDYACRFNEVQHDVHMTYARKNTEGSYNHQDVVRASLEIERRIQEEANSWNISSTAPVSSTTALAKYLDIAQDANSSLNEGLKAISSPPKKNKEQEPPTASAADFELEDDEEIDTTGWRSNV